MPTLLLAGAKQLLELARQETSEAAESYVMLAASVLSHGAGACGGGGAAAVVQPSPAQPVLPVWRLCTA